MFLKRKSRLSRGKRKHPHLRMLQSTLVFWGVSHNLIGKFNRLSMAIFFGSKKQIKKINKKTEKRLVGIVVLVVSVWLIVATVWPTKVSSEKPVGNQLRVAAENKYSSNNNLISQEITGQDFPFEFVNPLTNMQVSQKFQDGHLAIDLATDFGSDIKPVAPGLVEKAGWDPYGKGKIIVVNHGQNIKTLYAHLSKINVVEGEVVDFNTVIGKVGLTGHTTGAHLHLEATDNKQSVNPANFLQNNLTDL